MALINCPECNRPNVSDSAEACPDCGYAIKVHFENIKLKEQKRIREENDRIEQEKKRKYHEELKEKRSAKRKEVLKQSKYLLFIILSIVVAFGSAWGGFNYLRQNRKSDVDVKELLEKDNNEILESLMNICNYIIGNQLLLQGEYNDAIEILGMVYGFDDTLMLIENARYGIAMDFIDSGNVKESFEILYWLNINANGKYGDEVVNCIVQDCNEVMQYALELYDNSQIEDAKKIFSMINIQNPSDELENYIWYCREYSKIQGYWYDAKNKSNYIVVNGRNVEIHGRITSNSNLILNSGTYQSEPIIKVNALNSSEYVAFELCETIVDLHLSTNWYGSCIGIYFVKNRLGNNVWLSNTYVKEDAEIAYWNQEPQLPPRIGMTAEEVRNSTWGEPNKINKITYSWGVKEQWCYSGYRYVYFENGVVTAISE